MKNNIAVAALTLGLFAVAGGAQTTTKSSTSHSRTMTTTSYSSGGGSSAPDQDVKDDLFAGTEMFAKNASSATEINMGPDGLGMASSYGHRAAHNLVLNVVRTYSFDKPGMYNMADVDVYRQKVNTGDWHCSIHSRELKTGESTDICNKRRTDGMVETAIITVEPKELTFIHTIRKQEEGGDHGGEAMVSYDNMPIFAMLGNQGEMAAMRAEMLVDSALMRAQMAPLAAGRTSFMINDHELQNLTSPLDKDHVILKKFKRDEAAPKAKQDFMIITPDEPAAAVTPDADIEIPPPPPATAAPPPAPQQ